MRLIACANCRNTFNPSPRHPRFCSDNCAQVNASSAQVAPSERRCDECDRGVVHGVAVMRDGFRTLCVDHVGRG